MRARHVGRHEPPQVAGVCLAHALVLEGELDVVVLDGVVLAYAARQVRVARGARLAGRVGGVDGVQFAAVCAGPAVGQVVGQADPKLELLDDGELVNLLLPVAPC